jgi:hypothetical protein
MYEAAESIPQRTDLEAVSISQKALGRIHLSRVVRNLRNSITCYIHESKSSEWSPLSLLVREPVVFDIPLPLPLLGK